MNETQWLFTAIAAFAVGYGVAYLTKHIRQLANRWGIFSILLIPAIIMTLFSGASMINEAKDIGLSLVFAAGFIVRMIKR